MAARGGGGAGCGAGVWGFAPWSACLTCMRSRPYCSRTDGLVCAYKYTDAAGGDAGGAGGGRYVHVLIGRWMDRWWGNQLTQSPSLNDPPLVFTCQGMAVRPTCSSARRPSPPTHS